MRSHLTPVRMGKINKTGNNKYWRGCQERGNFLHCWWNVNWYSHSGKLCGRYLKQLKIDLPYDPAIALLEIYPKDTDAIKHRDTCTLMFLAAISTIAKLWKDPRCPSKDEWIKRCGLCIQWNIPQPLETTNTHHLLQRAWNWRVLC